MAQYVIKFMGKGKHKSLNDSEFQIPHPFNPTIPDRNYSSWLPIIPNVGVEINIAHARRENIQDAHKDCNCQITVVEI